MCFFDNRSGASQEVGLDVLKAVQLAYAKAHESCEVQERVGRQDVPENLCEAFKVLERTFCDLTTLLEELAGGKRGNLVPKQYEQYEKVWTSQEVRSLPQHCHRGQPLLCLLCLLRPCCHFVL